MAESSLTMTVSELRNHVSRQIGWGLTAPTSGQKSTELNEIIKSGLRAFYYPALPNGKTHHWSFLRPADRITTVAPYTTGTVSVASGGTTVTLVGGSFPSWVGSGYELWLNGQNVIIASRTDSTHIELVAGWPEATISPPGNTYSVVATGYQLPDAYAGLVGNMVLHGNLNREVVHTTEMQIRSRQAGQQFTGYPQLVGVRPNTKVAGQPQRFAAMFWPIPDAVYVLTYRYEVNPDAMNLASTDYPWGGLQHSETIVQACLAIAEQRIDRRIGEQTALFQQLLVASVDRDRKAHAPAFLGYTSDPSNTPDTLEKHATVGVMVGGVMVG